VVSTPIGFTRYSHRRPSTVSGAAVADTVVRIPHAIKIPAVSNCTCFMVLSPGALTGFFSSRVPNHATRILHSVNHGHNRDCQSRIYAFQDRLGKSSIERSPVLARGETWKLGARTPPCLTAGMALPFGQTWKEISRYSTLLTGNFGKCCFQVSRLNIAQPTTICRFHAPDFGPSSGILRLSSSVL